MSAVPPQQPGPREARIKQIWDSVWLEYSRGGVFEALVAIAEAELAGFAANIPANDIAASNDMLSAQNTHLFQSKHFAAHVDKVEKSRALIGQCIEWVYSQITQFNEHAVRSLTLANGGVVLATLAYVQAQNNVALGFVWVIALGAAGYLLTLLGSHAVVVLSSKPLQIMIELWQPRVAEEVRISKSKDLQRLNKWMVWVSRPLFYGAGLCLVAALWIGVATLTASRPTFAATQVQSQPVSKHALQNQAPSRKGP